MRIRPLAGLSERGFSFDLVSRKKTARAEEAPEAGAEHEAPTGNPTLQLTDPILDDPDLMVEPFETVLQQLRGTVEAERQELVERMDSRGAAPPRLLQRVVGDDGVPRLVYVGRRNLQD